MASFWPRDYPKWQRSQRKAPNPKMLAVSDAMTEIGLLLNHFLACNSGGTIYPSSEPVYLITPGFPEKYKARVKTRPSACLSARWWVKPFQKDHHLTSATFISNQTNLPTTVMRAVVRFASGSSNWHNVCSRFNSDRLKPTFYRVSEVLINHFFGH